LDKEMNEGNAQQGNGGISDTMANNSNDEIERKMCAERNGKKRGGKAR
jgi:hypothetical protein